MSDDVIAPVYIIDTQVIDLQPPVQVVTIQIGDEINAPTGAFILDLN